MIKQQAIIQELNQLVTIIGFEPPSDNSEYFVCIFVFPDVGLPSDSAQLFIVCGLLIGSLNHETYYLTVSRASHEAKCSVRFIAAEKIPAASEGINEGMILKRKYALLLILIIELLVVLDSKDLYTSLFTHRQLIDSSIPADVNYIWYQSELGSADQIC